MDHGVVRTDDRIRAIAMEILRACLSQTIEVTLENSFLMMKYGDVGYGVDVIQINESNLLAVPAHEHEINLIPRIVKERFNDFKESGDKHGYKPALFLMDESLVCFTPEELYESERHKKKDCRFSMIMMLTGGGLTVMDFDNEK